MDEKMLLEAMRQMMKEELEPLNARMGIMENDMQSLKGDVANIPTMQKDIRIILDGIRGINEKFDRLDNLTDDVEDHDVRITALEDVTRSHTEQLRKAE